MSGHDKTGGPAFPCIDGVRCVSDGMTLRDYFATNCRMEDIYVPDSIENCAAYIGIETKDYKPEIHYNKVACKARYQHADAMLAERDK